ncbi:unnamed protein product [Darwinula stevensoni]|uniref:Septin-type G domain-containing protein n=1 Tax=Darwinula stevensoni TaxID=69355 RepID=A0A7R8WY48_9CRUS|nr:unnamed protein product [Darwinula stevensoni]CAG0878936.1 unnamed protein product [Darwinula stevensoni]
MLGSGVTPGFRNPAVNKLALRHLESQDIDSKEDEQNHGQEESTEKPALQNKREMFFKNDHSNHIQAQSGVNKEGGNKDNQALYGSTPVQNAKEALFQHQHQNQHASNQSSHKEQPAVKKEEKNHQMNHHPPPPPPSHNQEESEREKPVVRDRDKEKERDRREKEEKGNISVPKCRELEAYVGFAILPDQVYRKAVKRGFEFTLMVVGESGTGKSTLLNSMFMADIYSPEYPGPSHRIKKTVQVEATKVLLKEKGVHLSLTLVDTPGFGDAVNNSNCWQPIVDYIDSHYEEYLNNESRVSRKKMPDNRVHCCLYFIAPTGHGLKPLDVEFMKRLHEKVNLVPVIAKADTFTSEECHLFKKQNVSSSWHNPSYWCHFLLKIMLEIRQHKIKIYEFPEGREEEERVQKPLRDRVPFAVVGSNAVLEVDGRKVRGRKYPWGLVEGWLRRFLEEGFLAGSLRPLVVQSPGTVLIGEDKIIFINFLVRISEHVPVQPMVLKHVSVQPMVLEMRLSHKPLVATWVFWTGMSEDIVLRILTGGHLEW